MAKVLEAITRIKEVLAPQMPPLYVEYMSALSIQKMVKIFLWYSLLSHLPDLKRVTDCLKILLPVMRKSMVWVVGEETSQKC